LCIVISKQQTENLYLAVETALVGIVCFVMGERLSHWVHDGKGYLDGLWCMISALVVLQSFIDDALKASKDRVVGTLVASLVSVLVCSLFGYGYLAIALSAFIMNGLKMADGVRIATATAAVITAYGFINPDESPWLNAAMRSVDTLIGTGVALAVVFLSYKLTLRSIAAPN